MELKIDRSWQKPVQEVMKRFQDKIKLLDAAGARRCMIELVTMIRSSDADEPTRRDASIALELIQQIDYGHPEQVLIGMSDWKGDIDLIKKNALTDLKLKNYDSVADLVPKIIYLVETNTDLYIKVKSAEILSEISKKHPLLLEKYQPRFFKMMFDDSLDVTNFIADVLYNIDFQTFGTHSPEKIRKILSERFEENLVNAWMSTGYSRHLLRLEVNVENFTRNWIFDVAVRVKNDPGFSVANIEPEYPAKQDPAENATSIDMNVVQNKAAKKLFVYIEPLYQQTISVLSKIAYKNHEGRRFDRELMNDTIDLFSLVPQFLTNVNFGHAHCKEYFEFKAKFKQIRKFAIPEVIKAEHLTIAIKNVMDAESIVSVNEYITDNVNDETEYYSELYFHGQTKIARDEVVVVTRVSGEDKTLTFMIAADREIYLAGLYNKLLARLYAALNHRPFTALECPRCFGTLDRGMTFCPSCKAKLG
ncbi:MAG: hypothetical protein JW839_12165 [Candidatus Lokiarchaeota archaeon]|nr:hypothetical protein [Candidatus Lokiarchaeota archaeon]